MANSGAKPDRSASRAVLAYNVLRAGLFAACFGLGWVAGLRSILLIVAALLVSGVLSWFVLRKQRIAMGQAVELTVERSRVRMTERTTAEDDYVDATTAADVTPSRQPTPATGDHPAQ